MKYLPLILFIVFFVLPILGRNGFPILVVIAVIAVLYFKFKKAASINGPLGGFGRKTTLSDILSKFFKENISNNINNNKIIDMDTFDHAKRAKHFFLSIVVGVLVLWLFFASIQIVDAGETGVYSLFGRVKEAELKSGFHLVIPLAKVTRLSIRTEEYTMSIVQGEGKHAGADSISALTKEGLNVDLDMTVLYKIMEDKADEIYRTVGLNYEEKIIRPIIRTAIRDVIAQYEAKDIYSVKREEAAKRIFEKIGEEMSKRGMTVENVLMRNVVLPPRLAQSIQEKLQAEQEAEKYDFILQKEAKEKERKIIEAEGQRDAQKIINESLSTNYLYYLYISDLKSREGTIYVPTSPGTGMPLFRNLGE